MVRHPGRLLPLLRHADSAFGHRPVIHSALRRRLGPFPHLEAKLHRVSVGSRAPQLLATQHRRWHEQLGSRLQAPARQHAHHVLLRTLGLPGITFRSLQRAASQRLPLRDCSWRGRALGSAAMAARTPCACCGGGCLAAGGSVDGDCLGSCVLGQEAVQLAPGRQGAALLLESPR
jgi:hypothetical protein